VTHFDSIAAARIAAYTAEHGGGTFSASTGEPHEGPGGFAVGLAIGSAAILPASATPEHLAATLARVAAEFECTYVGTWLDFDGPGDPAIHIDPVQILSDRGLALQRAAERGQRSIYSFEQREVIEV
jgi:hypothetical protein